MLSERRLLAGSRSGVTLVELVVAMAVGGMVCLGLGYVYALNTGLWLRSQVKLSLHAHGTGALEEIRRAASHAEEFFTDGDRELRLAYPPSPLGEGHPAPADTVFQLREGVLLRDGRRLVPSVGDTLIRVADFLTLPVSRDGGPRTLSVRLALCAREVDGRPGDTLFFETAVHARNLETEAGTDADVAGRKRSFE